MAAGRGTAGAAGTARSTRAARTRTAGPLAKAALKMPCNSVAWSLVSLPLETSPLMRSSIFDFRSSGEGLVPLAWSLARLDCIAESISVSADDNASLSDELMTPELTSDSNSFCNF